MKKEVIQGFFKSTDYTGFDPQKVERIAPLASQETTQTTTVDSKPVKIGIDVQNNGKALKLILKHHK